MRTGSFPSLFKHATYLLISKLNQNHTTPKGYRPISLLPIPSTLLEAILAKRLVREAKAIGAITPTQFGAIANHNAINALLEIVEAAIN